MVGVVVELGEIEPGWAELVGAKAANLGALHRIEGVRVPPGFCVTAAGFRCWPVSRSWRNGSSGWLRSPRGR
ncbi:MAG: PEP/pyruvate-binding domain-containing protein [Acidimicrobiales bacterium]